MGSLRRPSKITVLRSGNRDLARSIIMIHARSRKMAWWPLDVINPWSLRAIREREEQSSPASSSSPEIVPGEPTKIPLPIIRSPSPPSPSPSGSIHRARNIFRPQGIHRNHPGAFAFTLRYTLSLWFWLNFVPASAAATASPKRRRVAYRCEERYDTSKRI